MRLTFRYLHSEGFFGALKFWQLICPRNIHLRAGHGPFMKGVVEVGGGYERHTSRRRCTPKVEMRLCLAAAEMTVRSILIGLKPEEDS